MCVCVIGYIDLICMHISINILVSTLARNAGNVSLIPALDTLFLIFITTQYILSNTGIMYKLCTVRWLNLHRVCICAYIYM